MIRLEPLQPAQLQALRAGDLVATCTLPAVTMTQLAFYCAATGVTDPIHYDRAFAHASGFPDAVVNGSLRVAWMAQVLDALTPPAVGELTRLACSHRGLMLVGQAPRYEVRLRRQCAAPDGAVVVELEVKAFVGDLSADVGEATLHLKGDSAC